MLEIIDGKRGFSHQFVFYAPLQVRDKSSVDKPANLWAVQSIKQWAIDSLKNGTVLIDKPPVELSKL
jgi:hypothetical protein